MNWRALQRRSGEDRKQQVVEEAASWLERLERTLSNIEAADFRNWLDTPLHREVIVERCTLWHGVEVLAVLGTLIPDDVAVSRLPPKPGGVAPALSWVLAICLVGFSTFVLLGGPSGLAFKVDKRAKRVDEFYRTPFAGRREVKLPDGATIAINTASSVFVNYGPNFRDAALLRGEAMFDIPRDALRPFHLTAGARVVEIEQSRFALRRLPSGNSEITVLAGAVKILHPRASVARTPAQRRDSVSYSYGEATLLAAQTGVFGPDWQLVAKLTANEAQAKIAWRRGVIIFTDAPLDDALAEAARYVPREFVFADEGLRNVRLSGEFRTGDIDSILRVLRDAHRIESRPDAQGRIVLARLR
jgi:transmembrane sensor